MTRRWVHACLHVGVLRVVLCDSEQEADRYQERHEERGCEGMHFAVNGAPGASFEVIEHQIRCDLRVARNGRTDAN